MKKYNQLQKLKEVEERESLQYETPSSLPSARAHYSSGLEDNRSDLSNYPSNSSINRSRFTQSKVLIKLIIVSEVFSYFYFLR